MSISTYAELQTAVSNWVDRSDLTARIPEFISICEARVNRRLRIRETQVEADVTITGGTRTAALPSDFAEVRRLYLNASPIKRLEYMTPNDYWDRFVATVSGKPTAFTIEASNIVLGPIPDGSYTGKLLYYKNLAALSSSAHAVFTANPDLYLYGSLLAAEPFLKNDKRVSLWESQFNNILMELEVQSQRVQGPMRMRDDSNPY